MDFEAEQARYERLGAVRTALLVVAGVVLLLGTVPWVQSYRADRARWWRQVIEWDRLRLEGAGRNMTRAYVRNKVDSDRQDAVLEQLNLDQPEPELPREPVPPDKRPPWSTLFLYTFGAGVGLAASIVHQRQAALIQAFNDARAAARRAREAAEAQAQSDESTRRVQVQPSMDDAEIS